MKEIYKSILSWIENIKIKFQIWQLPSAVVSKKSKAATQTKIICDVVPNWGGPSVKSLPLGYYEPESLNTGKGPIEVQNKTKMLTFQSAIVGIGYQIKNPGELESLLEKLGEYAELQVKHEPKNTHDPFALAVYFNSKKIGYIPKGWNYKIIDGAKQGVKYNFFSNSTVDVTP